MAIRKSGRPAAPVVPPKPRKYAYINPDKEWRKRLGDMEVQFTGRNLASVNEEIEDKVYAMALDGVPLITIADYFGVDRGLFASEYEKVWRAGKADLQAIILKNTVDYGLKSEIPVAKIWLGKAMAGLGETKSVDIESGGSDNNEVTLNISVIRKEDKPE